MTLSSPSFLAAATNESMPPQSLADVAVLALQLAVPPPDVPPQAARTTSAATAVPRWRVKLPNLILSLPLYERAGRPTGGLEPANDGPSPATLQGQSSSVRLISVRPGLMPAGGRVSAPPAAKPEATGQVGRAVAGEPVQVVSLAQAVRRARDVERRDHLAVSPEHRRGEGVEPDLELLVGAGHARLPRLLQLRRERRRVGDGVRRDAVEGELEQPLAHAVRREGRDHLAARGAVHGRALAQPVDADHGGRGSGLLDGHDHVADQDVERR